MDVLILVGGFAVLCALGMPVAYALGLAAVLAALWIDIPLEAVMLKVSDGTDDFALLAIPFFILAGGIMAEGGLAERLVNLAKIFVGFIRGGLALVNILASAFFGCISGSSVADTASIGSVMVPQMEKNGYPRLFAVSITCAGSLQPLLIPPSHNAVIYSLAAGGTISIADLFLAGAIPGFLLGLCLMALVLVIARRRNFPKGEPIPPRRALRIIVEAFWALLTVFIIIVGILMIMIGFSVAFGYMMALMQVPAKAAQFFLTVADNKYTLLLLINLLLLVLGTFMDLAPMLLICTPIFLPIVTQFGIDPVHFGIIMILNLGIGLLTPPVGPTLAVGCAIGKVPMETLSRAILPFYLPMLLVLILVTYVPALSLWLPSLFQ